MTVAQYLTPKGTVIQAKGLQPDLIVPVSLMHTIYLHNCFGSLLMFIWFCSLFDLITLCCNSYVQVTNPYISYLGGQLLGKPDLSSIDFNRAESIINACSAIDSVGDSTGSSINEVTGKKI